MKLRVKFTLFFTLIFLLLFLGFTAVFSFQSINLLISTVDDKLNFIFTGMTNFFNKNDISTPEKLLNFHKKQISKYKNINLDSIWFAFYSNDKKLLAQSTKAESLNITIGLDNLKKGFYSFTFKDNTEESFVKNNDNETMRIKIGTITSGSYTFYIAIGLPITEALKSIRGIRRQLVFHIIIIFMLITLIGIIYSKYTLSPFTKITNALEHISGDNLSTRVPLKKSDNRNEVGLLTNSINKLLDKLEDSFNMEKQFISDVSHEFKTPIASLRLIIENVINSEEVTEEGAKKLSQTLDVLYSTDFLIKKLLNLYRLEQNQYKFNPQEENICTIIDAVFDNLNIIADMKNLNFTKHYNISPILLTCDKELLYMAIYNIVENGLKYTDKGSVIILVTESDNDVTITVEDTGVGIEQSEIKKIFQRFYRADYSRGEKRGYGIGLSMVDRIIKLHKGKIGIESIIGIKTKVTIVLPLLK